MHILFRLFAIASLLVHTSQGRAQELMGIYHSEEDYANKKFEHLGKCSFFGEKVFHYTDPAGERQKLKAKNCGCWGIRFGARDYRVIDGTAYTIMLTGAIWLYSTGPIKVENEGKTKEDGVIIRAEMGNGGKKLFFHLAGSEGRPERILGRNHLAEIMKDDPEALALLQEGSGMWFITFMKSVIDGVYLYNQHQKEHGATP